MRFALASFAWMMVFVSGAAMAADIPGLSFPGRCVGSVSSNLDQLPQSEIEATVAAYFITAKAATGQGDIIASTRPAFTWANEARIACGSALGYLQNNYIDSETVRKCDCFYGRFVAFR